MLLGLSPVAVTLTSDTAPVLSKEFLGIQATTDCGFTLKRVREIIRTYSQMPRKDKYSHLNHLASLAKYLSVRLRTNCLWTQSRCSHLEIHSFEPYFVLVYLQVL